MIEDFSHGYWLVNAETVPFTGDDVTVHRDFGKEMLRYTRCPMLKLGTDHYRVQIESSIPSATIAVPEESYPDRDAPVLMAKDETVQSIVEAGAR